LTEHGLVGLEGRLGETELREFHDDGGAFVDANDDEFAMDGESNFDAKVNGAALVVDSELTLLDFAFFGGVEFGEDFDAGSNADVGFETDASKLVENSIDAGANAEFFFAGFEEDV
jgi:hypothetical protein